MRLALLAIVLTSCAAPLQYRQAAALAASAGGLGAAVAYSEVREAALADCVSARVAADVLPDVAVALTAPEGTSVIINTDVSWCLQYHGAAPVDAVSEAGDRLLIRLGLTGLLNGLSGVAPDECAKRWTKAVTSSLGQLAGEVIDALGTASGDVSLTWTTPERCGE